MSRKFTGYHMLAVLVAFFGTVIAVNLTMASLASSTFGGIQVQNSYVASQNFNTWLEQAEEQEKLGWQVASSWQGDGRLRVTATGPGPAATLQATARHPLGQMPDLDLAFERAADGAFVSLDKLPPGRWIVRLQLNDGASEWRREDRF
jgi:nitrogen fixation protein FixH